MSDPWRNAIVESGYESPDQLVANPRNWRIHPRQQLEELESLLSDVGWVARVIVNRRTGHVVDGHARVTLAMERGEPEIPVDYVDLSEEQEARVLASFDPIAAMAGADGEVLAELVRECDADLTKLLARYLPKEAPESFDDVTTLGTEHECPKCGYRW